MHVVGHPHTVMNLPYLAAGVYAAALSGMSASTRWQLRRRTIDRRNWRPNWVTYSAEFGWLRRSAKGVSKWVVNSDVPDKVGRDGDGRLDTSSVQV
jgi:hypothetical protein